ncbi:hypothetical protein SAMN05216548_10577 [Faunimonas pinastri]|uniref:Nucleotidyltransferase family protein n=1 Tax=Faunimonas pinastri TaxID=1855383 RepID=A0A1H9GLS0_9HYPH|nr:nucleotidyltransferase family protein [Faunimonas pinastri]SEQ50868.1 hypothetical protein SAMN05216548_10577 [Faunimonas pinastri]
MRGNVDVAEDERRARLEAIVRADPTLMLLLRTLRSVDLPQWRLAAGCLYQTVWSVLSDVPRGTGIRDYDIVYFDADPSWEAEDRAIRRVGDDLKKVGFEGVAEVRNQARVHLWYEERFGAPYAALASADEALSRYAAIVHAVAVRLGPDDRLDIAAPFGLADLFDMVIRPNEANLAPGSYLAKAERARAIWPRLTVLPWHREG